MTKPEFISIKRIETTGIFTGHLIDYNDVIYNPKDYKIIIIKKR